MYERALVVIRC